MARPIRDPITRLLARVAIEPGGCWHWQGERDIDGYGTVWFKGGNRRAHRVMWELTHARPIPDGLTLDHLCEVRDCVNPLHCVPATAAANTARRRTCNCDACPTCQRRDYMREWSRRPENAQRIRERVSAYRRARREEIRFAS